MSVLYGGIEAGGTKFVCAVGTGPEELAAETRFPTTSPQEVIPQVLRFFRDQEQRLGCPLTAVGIATFGPVDLNPASPTFGHITSTPKPGWQNVDLPGEIGGGLNIPVGLDTDVNAAALAEGLWGAAQGLDTFVYLTVGTGIGGGGMAGGRLIHGMLHPEMGHLRIPHDRQIDPYAGCCPYHGDCLEGLASGPAIEGRWGIRAEALPSDHPAWALEAHYLALALVNLICTLSPQRIILGGGVMRRHHLFPMIRLRVRELLHDYLRTPQIREIEAYIVPPRLGERVGVLGAIALAKTVASHRDGGGPGCDVEGSGQ